MARLKKYLNDKEFYISKFLANAVYRAKQGNMPFDLTFEYLMSIVTNECPIFKTVFNWKQLKTGKGKAPNDSPTLDKIIPELGYVQGNVAFISRRANKMKDDGTMQEHYAIADWIWNHTHVKENTAAPISTRSDQQGKVYPELGTIPAAGSREDHYDLDHYQRTVQGEDSDYRTQTRGGNSMGRGGQEVGTFVTSYDIQNNGLPCAEVILAEQRGRHIPDKP